MTLLCGTLGFVLLAVALLLGRRASKLDDELLQHQIRRPPFSHFADQAYECYRPAGWPLLDRLRRTVLLIYVCGVVGFVLALYAWPRL
jgi:hypothetical protein